MEIVLICRSFEKVLGNPWGALGSHFENHCTAHSEVRFASCVIFIHYISLILSCPPNPQPHTHDNMCEILMNLVIASGLSPPLMLFCDCRYIF